MIFPQIDDVKLIVLLILALLTIRKARQLHRPAPVPINYDILHEVVPPPQNATKKSITQKRINGREEYWKKYGKIHGRKLIKCEDENDVNDEQQKQDTDQVAGQKVEAQNVRQTVIEGIPAIKIPEITTLLTPKTSSRSTVPSQSEQSLGRQLLYFSDKSDKDQEEICQSKNSKKQQNKKNMKKNMRIPHKKKEHCCKCCLHHCQSDADESE